MVAIKRLNSADASFKAQLDDLLAFEGAQDDKIEQTVAVILADVKKRGDAAVIEYTNRFDRLSAKSMAELELSRTELEAALNNFGVIFGHVYAAFVTKKVGGMKHVHMQRVTLDPLATVNQPAQ